QTPPRPACLATGSSTRLSRPPCRTPHHPGRTAARSSGAGDPDPCTAQTHAPTSTARRSTPAPESHSVWLETARLAHPLQPPRTVAAKLPDRRPTAAPWRTVPPGQTGRTSGTATATRRERVSAQSDECPV